jgi:hypothetical protein
MSEINVNIVKRHNRATRMARRALFRFSRLPLVFVAHVSHRAYMALYVPLLRTAGMQLDGTPRYISEKCYFDDLSKITLGDRVVISSNVRFLTHDYSVTTALRAIGVEPPTDIASDRRIVVGSNVFIGLASIVMPNSRIGSNVIVGAGAVVRGDIPPYSIVTGNPATIVGDVREYGHRWRAKLAAGELRRD